MRNTTSIRTVLLVLTLTLLSPVAWAIEDKNITSTIKQVTVFLSGAQVERTAQVELPKGSLGLVFKGLSAEADPASIQIGGTGGFTILSVKHRLDHGAPPATNNEVSELDKQIKALSEQIQDDQLRIGVFQNEEQRLLKNESFDGGEQGLSMERIKAINDYFRERIAAVRDGIIGLQRTINTRTEEAQRLHLRLEQLQGVKPKASSDVLVEIVSERALTSTVTLRYVVRSAGWSPQYDIRVHDISSPLALTYKARVFQNTGEDWKEVRMALASGDPRASGVMPEMDIWRLGHGARPPGALQRNGTSASNTVREVRGLVRDASTAEALPFVNIGLTTADGTVLNGTATDFDGRYACAVPTGARDISFNFIGYEPQRHALVRDVIDVGLKQSAVMLSEVEVVQYKRPLIDRDAMSAATITQEQIRKEPQRMLSPTRVLGSRAQRNELHSSGAAANYGDVTGGMINTGPAVDTQRATTYFTFNIAVPYSIPSDGQGHMVAVNEHEVASTYRYYCTPRLDPSAYLFAKATGWDQLDLIPGPVNLYFEGTFIGESFLDAAQVNDTLDISLGRDKSVVVVREKQREMRRSTFTGNKRTEMVGWSIDVRNNKQRPIDLVIADQLPVAVVSEVEVELTAADGGSLDKGSGHITWRDKLEPGTTKRHLFSYTVKAPRSMDIHLE